MSTRFVASDLLCSLIYNNCACIYICIYICIHKNFLIYRHIHIYIWTYLIHCLAPTVPPIETMANLLLYSPLPTPWTRTNTHTTIYAHAHTHALTQTQTHKQTHIHTYTQTQAYAYHCIASLSCHQSIYIICKHIFLTFTKTYYHGKLVDKSMKHA